jgi:hypothetical protein
MIYTQARLDEAIFGLRECKSYLERRGHKTGNLEAHLGRKYEFRKPPPAIAFAPRPTLWAGRDDDSDGEFDPSKEKKKKTIQEPRSGRSGQRKRKRSTCGEDSGESKKIERKAKGTTWAKGRREGRIEVIVFKFTKTGNLDILKALREEHGDSARIMPHEEHINVFNANGLDSGFTPPSSSGLHEGAQSKEKPDQDTGENDLNGQSVSRQTGGTFANPSIGLPTPRSSISDISSLPKLIDSTIPTADYAQHTRGLRNRTVPLTTPQPLRSCLSCKNAKIKCTLLQSPPEYEGRCETCNNADSECRVNKDDQPRVFSFNNRSSTSSGENNKRPLEEGEPRGSKKSKNIGSVPNDIDDHDDEPNLADGSGLGKSLLQRRKDKISEDKKRDNLMASLVRLGRQKEMQQSNSLGRLNTSLANSTFDFSAQHSSKRDSGYASDYSSSPFTSTPPNLSDISMGATLGTAICLSDTSSPPLSPIRFPRSRSPPVFAADTTISIITDWAHPMAFQHRPGAAVTTCHFCADYHYGIVGCGHLVKAEVAWSAEEKGYIELSGGHVSLGCAPSRMCGSCALERLRIRFCGCGSSVSQGKSRERDMGGKHRVTEMAAWRGDNRIWGKALLRKPDQVGYSVVAPLMPCHLCMMPAVFRCMRMQERSSNLGPLKEGETGRQGCGLRLCMKCKELVEGGAWEKGRLVGGRKFGRADAEFLFPGGGLDAQWGDYSRNVGLLE